MAWQRRYFKGKKVYVEVDEHGELVVDAGRVSMKYSAAQDAKVYSAGARNISGPLDDNGQPQQGQPQQGQPQKGQPQKKKNGSQTRSSKSSGTKPPDYQIQPTEAVQVSTQIPDELRSYPLPMDGVVEIYTDGACSHNPGPCGYGLLMRQGDDYRELNQYLGIGTNNIAELTAIKVALEHVADKSASVRLHTDSRYAIGVLVDGWKAKANRELILDIRKIIADFTDLKLIKVKGHAGQPLNERADFLATSSLNGH